MIIKKSFKILIFILSLLSGLALFNYNNSMSYYLINYNKSYAITKNICDSSDNINLIPLLTYGDIEFIQNYLKLKGGNIKFTFEIGEPMSTLKIVLKGRDISKLGVIDKVDEISSLILEREKMNFYKKYKDIKIVCATKERDAYKFLRSNRSTLLEEFKSKYITLNLLISLIIPLIFFSLLIYLFKLIKLRINYN